MGITLQKGGNISLSKEAPNLVRAVVGLGWDERQTDGADFDLDASAFMTGEAGKCRTDADFIFYNQLKSVCESVVHTGDNRTGAGDGDDEQIKVDLSKVPADITEVNFTVTIHDAAKNGQNFGQVERAFIRIVNEDDGKEIVRYDLTEDHSTETAITFGKLYRHAGEWKFKAVGQGFAGGLKALSAQFGLKIND